MNKMKPYLTDVAVCIYIWVRKEIQHKTFSAVCEARPSKVFIISDGGRNDDEWRKIYANRAMVESMIDWDCMVYKLYFEENQGAYAISSVAYKDVFEKVDSAIILEDDILVDPSFIPFCAELLEKYKDDLRIGQISGLNVLEKYDEPDGDYFFAKTSNIWGFALWKRSLEMMFDDEWKRIPYVYTQMGKQGPPHFDEGVKRYVKYGKAKNGHEPSDEFYTAAINITNNQLCVIPKKNMVRNIGATEDAEHMIDLKKLDRKTQVPFTIPIHQCEFPMVHPKYVIEDKDFLKMERAIMRPGDLEKKRRHFVTICKRIYYGDFTKLVHIFWKRYIKREIKIEK